MQRSGASSSQATFSATLAAPEGLKAVMSFCSGHFTDVLAWHVDRDGLRIEAVDAAKSAFLVAFFGCSGSDSCFKSWRLDRESLTLDMDPSRLSKLLKAAGGAGTLLSTLTLSVGPPREDHLELQFHTVTKHGLTQRSTFGLALLTPVGECTEVVIDPSAFAFTSQLLTTQPAILCDVIAQLKAAECTEVALTLTASSVCFTSCGPALMNCEITLQEHSAGGKLCLAADAPYTASFAFKLATLCKVSSQVVLQLGPEAPLSLVCQLCGGGFVLLYLAPVIADGDSDSGMGA